MIQPGTNVAKLTRQGSVTGITGATTGQLIIGPSPTRVSLKISTNSGAGVSIGTTPSPNPASDCYTIAASSPLELTLYEHGNLCQAAWYHVAGTTPNYGVIQVEDNSLVQE
jgi:hypothetical protein